MEKLLKELELSEEQVRKILTKYNNDKGEWENKLNSKNDEILTANTTIKDLSNKIKKFDDVDVEKLKQDVKNWEDKYNTDISNLRKNHAVDMAITGAKGKNVKAIKALLDMDKITFDEKGSLQGLDLEGLKKSDPYLFDIETTRIEGTGRTDSTRIQTPFETIKSQIENTILGK